MVFIFFPSWSQLCIVKESSSLVTDNDDEQSASFLPQIGGLHHRWHPRLRMECKYLSTANEYLNGQWCFGDCSCCRTNNVMGMEINTCCCAGGRERFSQRVLFQDELKLHSEGKSLPAICPRLVSSDDDNLCFNLHRLIVCKHSVQQLTESSSMSPNH